MAAHDLGLPPDRQAPIQGRLNSVERWKLIWGFAKGAMIVVIFALVIVQNTQTNGIVSAIRESQQQRAPLILQTAQAAKRAEQAAKAARQGVHILRDCLDPKGTCGKEGVAKTAEALHSIKQYIIDTARCQSLVEQPQDGSALEECVNRLEEGRGQQ